jgi:hypothetical protein
LRIGTIVVTSSEPGILDEINKCMKEKYSYIELGQKRKLRSKEIKLSKGNKIW